MTPAELKQQINKRAEEASALLKEIRENIPVEIQPLAQELEALNLKSTDDIKTLNDRLDKINQIRKEIKSRQQKTREIQRQIDENTEQYIKISLKESGFENFEELDTGIEGLKTQLNSLQDKEFKINQEKRKIGYLFNRKKVKENKDVNLTVLAARLHDIGKRTRVINTNQWFDNPVAAFDCLKKIRNISYEQQQDIFFLIQYDELIGDILQGKKPKEDFFQLFKTQRERKTLLALYRADVWEIDGTGNLYKEWQVDEKIKDLELDK